MNNFDDGDSLLALIIIFGGAGFIAWLMLMAFTSLNNSQEIYSVKCVSSTNELIIEDTSYKDKIYYGDSYIRFKSIKTGKEIRFNGTCITEEIIKDKPNNPK